MFIIMTESVIVSFSSRKCWINCFCLQHKIFKMAALFITSKYRLYFFPTKYDGFNAIIIIIHWLHSKQLQFNCKGFIRVLRMYLHLVYLVKFQFLLDAVYNNSICFLGYIHLVPGFSWYLAPNRTTKAKQRQLNNWLSSGSSHIVITMHWRRKLTRSLPICTWWVIYVSLVASSGQGYYNWWSHEEIL